MGVYERGVPFGGNCYIAGIMRQFSPILFVIAAFCWQACSPGAHAGTSAHTGASAHTGDLANTGTLANAGTSANQDPLMAFVDDSLLTRPELVGGQVGICI